MIWGMAKKPQSSLSLSEPSRAELTGWIRAHRTPQPVVKRCQIVLGSAEGQSDLQTAQALAVNRHTCRLWRQRFLSGGAAALWRVAPGRGRKPEGPRQQRIVAATIGRKPKGQTHWSTRTLAKDQGVSHTPCGGSGRPINSSRIWKRPSRFHATQSSWKNSPMSSGST